MKIILKADVHHLGRAGQTLNVKNGFARNYLFPRKLAIPAQSQSIKEWNHKKRMADLRAKKAQGLRNEIAKKLKDLKLSFQQPTTKQGKLFGSITLTDIARQLKTKGFDIDKKFIRLSAPIKSLGDHTINIDLGNTSQVPIEVSILDEKAANKKQEPSRLSKLVQFSKSLAKSSKEEDPKKET